MPQPVRAWLDFRRWGRLPRGGGTLDQPAGLLRKMTIAADVVGAVQGYDQATSKGELAKWANAHPEMMKLVKLVERLLESEDD